MDLEAQGKEDLQKWAICHVKVGRELKKIHCSEVAFTHGKKNPLVSLVRLFLWSGDGGSQRGRNQGGSQRRSRGTGTRTSVLR